MATGHQGTGRHGHKDSQEPWPHTKENRSERGREGSSSERSHSSSAGRDSGKASSESERESLKNREYRDESGEVHHHTRTYMEQHKDREH